jgi:hypothetical protein
MKVAQNKVDSGNIDVEAIPEITSQGLLLKHKNQHIQGLAHPHAQPTLPIMY